MQASPLRCAARLPARELPAAGLIRARGGDGSFLSPGKRIERHADKLSAPLNVRFREPAVWPSGLLRFGVAPQPLLRLGCVGIKHKTGKN